MNNIRENEFNKNVIEVYTQEPGFTGYKGFEFNKIDDIEDILKANMPAYDQIELKYDGSITTGVFYTLNGNLIRKIEMRYDGSSNLTGVLKTDY